MRVVYIFANKNIALDSNTTIITITAYSNNSNASRINGAQIGAEHDRNWLLRLDNHLVGINVFAEM